MIKHDSYLVGLYNSAARIVEELSTFNERSELTAHWLNIPLEDREEYFKRLRRHRTDMYADCRRAETEDTDEEEEDEEDDSFEDAEPYDRAAFVSSCFRVIYIYSLPVDHLWHDILG